MNGRTVRLLAVVRNVAQSIMSVKGLAAGIYKLIWTDDKLTYRRTIMIAQ
jgi:hypothetical protein